MTQHDQPQTVEDFLRMWYMLAEANNTPELEKWESQFPELAETAPT